MEEGKAYSGAKVFNIKYNHVHDWGAGIVSDFGAIYIGSSYNCDGASLAELEQHCYTHAHIFNNWVEGGRPYHRSGGHLYSDTSSSGTIFERNVLRGGGANALKHHCGLDNESKNNIVHRTNSVDSFDAIWTGCGKSHMDRFQRFTNYKNIYLLDTLEGLIMSPSHFRFYNEAPGKIVKN